MIAPLTVATCIFPGSVVAAAMVALWPRKRPVEHVAREVAVRFATDSLEEAPINDSQLVRDTLRVPLSEENTARDSIGTSYENGEMQKDDFPEVSSSGEGTGAVPFHEDAGNDEVIYFGPEPLTQLERLAALEKWWAQAAEEAHHESEDTRDGRDGIDPKPIVAVEGDEVADAGPQDQRESLDSQLSREQSSQTMPQIAEFTNSPTPEIGEALVKAFGDEESLRLPILYALSASTFTGDLDLYRRVVDENRSDENRSIEEVWIAIDGLQKHQCSDQLDQLLLYPAPLPAKALLALLPSGNGSLYEEYLSKSVSSEVAEAVLATLEPMLAL